jgi:signal transduction histidine kinase
MRERAALIGAALSFEGAAGSGTKVRLEVPLTTATASRR